MSFCIKTARAKIRKPDCELWCSSELDGSSFRRVASDLRSTFKGIIRLPSTCSWLIAQTVLRLLKVTLPGRNRLGESRDRHTAMGCRCKARTLGALNRSSSSAVGVLGTSRSAELFACVNNAPHGACGNVAKVSGHDVGGEGLRRSTVDHPRSDELCTAQRRF